VMSFAMPSIGGVNQTAATTYFSLWVLFALGKAFRHIQRCEIALHREWMIRAFSIGLAVATIRPIIAVFFATSRLSGLTPYQFFGVGFWIGFAPFFIAAEDGFDGFDRKQKTSAPNHHTGRLISTTWTSAISVMSSLLWSPTSLTSSV
jgi:hypothetical protein